ncbi:hypothetical protein [Paucidesulfovibrio longus]|uniref:hypothetical protein n=1 Tax=Paucidesulfovibrio longus TaxID=889 RepID=UPI0003B4371C|nr:hypothetical protein [Paucidesulfovibrio longus]
MAGNALPPWLQGLVEIFRRAACLGLLLLGAWLFLTPAERLLRVSLPDLRAKYERDAALHGEDAPGFGDWLEHALQGRTLAVSGPEWAVMASALQSPGETPTGAGNLPESLAGNQGDGGKDFWFAEDSPLARSLDLPKNEFRYLLPKDAPQARPLGAAFVEARHAQAAPERLRHPGRAAAPWLLLAALAAYALPPRPSRHSGAARYGIASAVIVPDLLGISLTLFFFSLPLLIVGSTTSPSELLSLDNGWAVLTLSFWSLALLTAALPATAARYACFQAYALKEGLILRTLWRKRRIGFEEIEETRAYDGAERARLLARLLLIFGGGMPQTMGMALLISRNVEWGLELRLVGAERLRLMFNSLKNAGMLLAALSEAGVAVPDQLKRACAGGNDQS